MPDELDTDAYRANLLLVYAALQVFAGLPLDQMIRAIIVAESVGPFLDPTAWRVQGPKMREDREVLEAARKAFLSLPTKMQEQMVRFATARDVRHVS